MDVVEIKLYKYFVFSSRDGQAKAAILLYGDSGYIGSVCFRGDEQPLQSAEKYQDGSYVLHYRYDDLDDIVDMLRNEKPVYLIYNADGNNFSCISTTEEPVGETELWSVLNI